MKKNIVLSLQGWNNIYKTLFKRAGYKVDNIDEVEQQKIKIKCWKIKVWIYWYYK